jgi:hypothetical protein
MNWERDDNGDWVRGPLWLPTIAVRRTGAGWYAFKKRCGWLHNGPEIWFFSTAASVISIASSAGETDFSWCGCGYGRPAAHSETVESEDGGVADLMDDAAQITSQNEKNTSPILAPVAASTPTTMVPKARPT